MKQFDEPGEVQCELQTLGKMPLSPVALGLVEKCCEIDSINFDRKRKSIILTRFFKLIASHKVSSFSRNNLKLLDFKDATQSAIVVLLYLQIGFYPSRVE